MVALTGDGLTTTGILAITIIIAALYQFVLRHYNYFGARGIKFIRGVPLFGTNYRLVLGREPFMYALQRIYNAFPGERLIGTYEIGGVPQYMLCDPKLIKEITIKLSDNFIDHRIAVDESSDALAARNVFFMKGQTWRDMRQTLSPVFTGSKMRTMMPFIMKCCDDFLVFLGSNGRRLDGDEKSTTFECEMKDIFSRFSNDTIASCAFGLDVNSLRDQDNEFFRMGESLTEPTTSFLLRNLGYCVMPRLMNALKIRLFKETDEIFFRGVLADTISHRRSTGVVRNDLLELLLKAQQQTVRSGKTDSTVNSGTQLKELSDTDLAAQCVIFYFAAFDTVSTALAFMAHELAVNADIQQRLYADVAAMYRSLDGATIGYEQLQTMRYLDMVVAETLRKWPPAVQYDRVCNIATTLDLGNGRRLAVEPGDGFMIPVFAIHRDPAFYPDPERFDPERFSAANASQLVSGAYMPFGAGPRACIGQRFGLMEMKAIMYSLLLEWRLEKCEKTQSPLRLGKGMFLTTEKGIWVRFIKRQ